MSSKNVLVVGGAGYIGSHTCKALFLNGFKPVVYDNLVYGHEYAVKWGVLEKGELSDVERLKVVLRRYDIVAVMHFASYAYVGESIEKPCKYYKNNVADALCLLESMLEVGVGSIVFSSSCATYGLPEIIPIKEDHVLNPINPYGTTKLIFEQILRDFNLAYGLKSVSLRYFNAAGADMDCEIGEDHFPETHLIPLVMDVALGRRDEIEIYGGDYETPDGTCIRDYVHVTDLAEAHLLALQYALKFDGSLAFNLSNGLGFSVIEIIKMIEYVTEQKVVYRKSKRRQGDPPILIGDYSKAREELGWEPKITSLVDIIQSAWDWHIKLKKTL